MGSMAFQLPAEISAEVEAELECACLGGGQDGMPFPTHVALEPGLLFVERTVNESGFLMSPWQVDGIGRLMMNSATLMERRHPYDFLLELARGKTHQLRNQMCEWVGGGLILGDDIGKLVQDATHAFGKAASLTTGNGPPSGQAIEMGLRAAQRLVDTYIDQVFQVRHLRHPRLDTLWACGVTSVPDEAVLCSTYRETFNGVSVPITWSDVEPADGQWSWDELDRRVAWAAQQGTVIGGPLVDFSGRGVPDWLWASELNLQEISERVNGFIDEVVRRYRTSIRHWRLTAASNWSGVLATNDEELIWLTVRALDAARRIDSQLQLSIGLCQPWGDYLATEEHNVTPFGFADTLLRTGARLDFLELELVMGIAPRGSFCRDTLDTSRILDLYVLLGTPLFVSLGYPSAGGTDANGDQDLRPGGGFWGSGYSPKDQGSWAATFGRLALCKPYVQGVFWSHWDDRAPHQFPHAGLIDSAGQPKPALDSLRQLRVKHIQ